MSTTLEKADILQQFRKHIHCSQIVFAQWAAELDLDPVDCRRIAAPFGGGYFRGDTCGAIAGAMLVIGARYGHSEPGDADGDVVLKEQVRLFLKKFEERCGALNCRDLLGYDFSQPGRFEEATLSGVIWDRCPGYVNTALEILDEMM